MASGYTVSGRGDLDALFALRTGAARANVGYQVNGTDLAQRYEPIGASSPIAATGFKTGGTDHASLFKDIAAASVTFPLANQTVLSTSGEPRNAGYRLNTNGTVDVYKNGAYTAAGQWINPTTGAPGAYRVRATQTSVSGGGSRSGTLATWTALTIAQTWTVSQSSAGSSQWGLTIEVDDGAGNIKGSCTVSLQTTR